MFDNFNLGIKNLYEQDILGYLQSFNHNPIKVITLIVDLTIVIFLLVKFIKIVKDSRAWQLLKGIAFLIIVTAMSSLLQLNILNYILTSFMTYGVLVLIVIFQPELRRALEQLGTNKISRFFGFEKDLATKTKEDIYKIVIAVMELAKSKIGALIVIQRDIKIQDIISTGIIMNSEISPQLLVNVFTPNTPLHDGAVVVNNNKIMAAACMLPLAGDKDISKELGTRHRAAIGISKESDAIAVVVSEETGKVSIAKDGTLIADVKEEALKKILITNIVTKRFGNKENNKKINIKKKITSIEAKLANKKDKKTQKETK